MKSVLTRVFRLLTLRLNGSARVGIRKKNHNEKSAELQAQLIARAEAKRERRAVKRLRDQTLSFVSNPIYAHAGWVI